MKELHSAEVPLSIKKLLRDLEVVRNLPEGYKLNVSSSTYSITWSLAERAYRLLTGENGQRTVSHLDELIDRVINESRRHPHFADSLIEAVCSLRTAVENLRSVYTGQPPVQADLLVIGRRLCEASLKQAIKPDRADPDGPDPTSEWNPN